jgi:hypothetical protein
VNEFRPFVEAEKQEPVLRKISAQAQIKALRMAGVAPLRQTSLRAGQGPVKINRL